MLEEADRRCVRVRVPGNLTVTYHNAVNKYGTIAEIVASMDKRATAADRLAKKAYEKGDMRTYAKACAARIQHRYAAYIENIDWTCKSMSEGEKFIWRIS
jgi:hypothetical protein